LLQPGDRVAADAAVLCSSKRFKDRRPSPAVLPTAAWINSPTSEAVAQKTNPPCTVN
jgi:hypothetical protein